MRYNNAPFPAVFTENKIIMSNSMSVEKIFIVLAIILGLGSTIDLIYSFVTLNLQLNEILRCLINIAIAGFLFAYFNKKHKAKIESNENKTG